MNDFELFDLGLKRGVKFGLFMGIFLGAPSLVLLDKPALVWIVLSTVTGADMLICFWKTIDDVPNKPKNKR